MTAQTELAQLAGGVIVGGFDGTTLPDAIRARLERGHLGGVTLFKRNIADVAQTAALCAALRACTPTERPPVISIDQEGGRVARLGPPVTPLPAMRVLGAIDDTALTERAGRMLGRMLGALGINVDFAPVADVDSNPANPVIGDRAFGREPERVARHVVALIRGLQGAGVLACAKHFPGHGDTEQDSHLDLPRVRHDLARLRAIELPPFRAAVEADVASVMTAHVVYEGLAPDVPATLSAAVVTDLLRHELGFRGVCFSDDLHMKAVSARLSVGECAVAAIDAGCDALLICTDPDSQERAREALVARAATDARFVSRLREANARMDTLRTQAAQGDARRDPRPLDAVLADPEHARLRDEIAERGARASV